MRISFDVDTHGAFYVCEKNVEQAIRLQLGNSVRRMVLQPNQRNDRCTVVAFVCFNKGDDAKYMAEKTIILDGKYFGINEKIRCTLENISSK